MCVSECVCERERELDGRCVCERVHGFHTFEETFFTALCYNPVIKRVMVTPASAEKVQLCRNSGSQHLV